MPKSNFSRKEKSGIALLYSTSSETYEKIAKFYGVSASTINKIIDEAIVESIVSDKIARNIIKKAAQNAGKKAGADAQYRSIKHGDELMARRATFSFTDVEAIKYTEQFTYSSKNIKDFASNQYMTEKLLIKTISHTVRDELINEEVCKILSEKIFRENIAEIEPLKKMLQNHFFGFEQQHLF